MNIEFIEEFCQNKGVEIVKILLSKNDSNDFEINSREIEKQIYLVTTSYSRILFFETNEVLQESTRNEVRTHLSSRFGSQEVEKMTDVELISHWIKSEVIKTLEGLNINLN